MTDEKKFSNFALNFNPAARGNEKAPTLRGKATVLAAASAIDFQVAAWGPNKAATGGPDFYNVTLTPADPALAARQLRTEVGPVRNKPEGFELTKLGAGRIFERTDEELAKNPKLPKFWGHALVLVGGEPAYLDLSAWKRDGFYSGNANVHDPKAAAAARAVKQHDHG